MPVRIDQKYLYRAIGTQLYIADERDVSLSENRCGSVCVIDFEGEMVVAAGEPARGSRRATDVMLFDQMNQRLPGPKPSSGKLKVRPGDFLHS